MKNSKVKIVRVSGIEEWYAPNYASPVMENDDIHALFDDLGLPYVYGPEIRKGERLCDDIGCIADRLLVDSPSYGDDFDKAVEEAFRSGKEQVVTVDGEPIKIYGEEIRITPYESVPEIPDSAYAEFGEFADIFKERVAAI